LAKKYKLKIIEDSSQAPGATYKGRLAGTIGDIGVFSFNVHKVIQSGEGGMLVTNNEKYAYRAQLVRNHGEVTSDDLWNNKDIPRELVAGSNYRLTEIQAAIMIEQLKKLSSLNNCRIALADYLSEKLKKFSWLRGPNVLAKSKHIYYLYPIKFLANKIGISRKTFIQAMLDEGFSLGAGYQKPLYLLKIYQNKRIYQSSQFPFVSKEYPQKFDYSKGICPVVEKMYEEEIFTTNICQSPKTKKDIDLFVKALEKIDKNIDLLKKYEREV
jgi:dTDP-4-amino-4,6-dideoxygalactose transaminase